MESTLTTTPTVLAEAIAAPPATGLADPLEIAAYSFTAEQFARMVEADIFPSESRVELWDGMVFEKMAKKRPHSVAANKFVAALAPLIPCGWHLAVEDSATVGPGRVPLPDIMVVRGTPDDYRARNPSAGDIALLIELSDSSLRFDTGSKLAGYAVAGVDRYWVANLVAGVIQSYREPISHEGRYAVTEGFARGQAIPFLLDGTQVGLIAVDDLLPLPDA